MGVGGDWGKASCLIADENHASFEISSFLLDLKKFLYRVYRTLIVDINHLILKFVWRGKMHNIVNKKENRVRGMGLFGFRTQYKAALIQVIWI